MPSGKSVPSLAGEGDDTYARGPVGSDAVLLLLSPLAGPHGYVCHGVYGREVRLWGSRDPAPGAESPFLISPPRPWLPGG